MWGTAWLNWLYSWWFGTRLIESANGPKSGIFIKLNKHNPLDCFGEKTLVGTMYACSGGTTEDKMFKLTKKEKNDLNYIHKNMREVRRPSSMYMDGSSNCLFLDSRFPDPFSGKLTKASEKTMTALKEYHTEIKKINFGLNTKATVNNWVEKQTNGKLSEQFGEGIINTNTAMVFVNTLYFQSNWAHQFDPLGTMEADFLISSSTGVRVPMMTMKGMFCLLKHKNVTGLKIPFKGTPFDMILILPNNFEVDNWEKLIENTGGSKGFKEFINQFPEEVNVKLSMPKFKSQFDSDLMIPGIPQESIDMSGVGKQAAKALFLSRCHMQMVIAINEKGAEAIGAIDAVMSFSSLDKPKQPTGRFHLDATKIEENLEEEAGMEVFNCNRPFYYMIRDKRQIFPVFMGYVQNPKA